jgi:hypothetical protein
VHSALPWAGEVPELIDELAAEKLPAALMEPILSERRARHEQHRAAAAAKVEAEARVDELKARIEDLAADELDELSGSPTSPTASSRSRRGVCATRSARAARRSPTPIRRWRSASRRPSGPCG